MKLLFDENLSFKLARRLADLFPDSTRVRDVGLKAADDSVVWEYARNNSTDDVEWVLRGNFDAIITFYEDTEATFLSLS